jgi:DNA helicase-2/ATP-dependent DNA helicase PcrA
VDKRVVFAVAGSGKTSHIINGLKNDSRTLLLTYTDNNLTNLKHKILEKFGEIPAGIKVYSYFQFLYSFCFRPLYGHELRTNGINWHVPPFQTLKMKRSDSKFYIDTHDRLYSNRIAKLIDQLGITGEVIKRIEKYFDSICIDEIQDFAGHDFNFLLSIFPANVNQLFVGDFYQHTFDTSRDGNVNKSLHDCYEKYKENFSRVGYQVDEELLSKSHRCSQCVCGFVSDNLSIQIDSHRSDQTHIEFIECKERAIEMMSCPVTAKLFYQDSKKYKGYTENWGATKGLDCFENICIILNPNTLKHFQNRNLRELKPQTKNKLYVAFTRAKQNIYLIPETLVKHMKN